MDTGVIKNNNGTFSVPGLRFDADLNLGNNINTNEQPIRIKKGTVSSLFNPSTDQNIAYSKERIKLNLARKAEFETAEQKNKTIMDQRTQLKKQPIRNNQSPAMEER